MNLTIEGDEDQMDHHGMNGDEENEDDLMDDEMDDDEEDGNAGHPRHLEFGED